VNNTDVEAPNPVYKPKLGWLECCFRINKDNDPGTCCTWRNQVRLEDLVHQDQTYVHSICINKIFNKLSRELSW